MILNPGHFSGSLQIPPSKSDAQRAILAAGLAEGKSLLVNVGKSNDEVQMIENIRLIGANVVSLDSTLLIDGVGSFPEKTEMNLGESGLGFRLIAGQCAIRGGNHNLSASGTLVNRPMDFYQNQFKGTGLGVSSNFAPMTFNGFSEKRNFVIDGSQSSQFISGLLMALPLAEYNSEVKIENLKSRPYLEMTISTMKHFGVEVSETEKDFFTIKGLQKYKAQNYTVESDWSAASCWLAASALGGGISLKGLSMQSLQADKKMLEAFVNAGCKVTNSENGIEVDGTKRRPFVFDANDCPDLFPALAILASMIDGSSTLFGLNRLQIKESDRGIAIQKEFQKMGIEVQLIPEEDKMIITGKNKVKSGKFSAHEDHRIAMAMGVLSAFMTNPSELEGGDSVRKSYPDFWNHRKDLLS
jgi:3-phosphoshikimate 1-carboxyvinyltransferase